MANSILLIDDEMPVLKVLQRSLRRSDLSVSAA